MAQEFPPATDLPGVGPDLQDVVARRQRELAMLAEISTHLHGEEDVQRMLGRTLDSLLTGFSLSTGWIFLEDEKDRKLRLAAHRGISPAYLEALRERGLGECLCRGVFESGRGRQALNRTDCPRMPSIGAGLEQPVAHASVPLAFNGTSRGILNLAAPQGRTFDDEELRFLETVGRQLCLAVEGARHLKQERLYNREARALAALNKGIG